MHDCNISAQRGQDKECMLTCLIWAGDRPVEVAFVSGAISGIAVVIAHRGQQLAAIAAVAWAVMI